MNACNVTSTAWPELQDAVKPYRAVHVHAQLLDIDPEEVYPEDRDSTGLWEVLVPSHLSEAHVANCAIDGYNSVVPIKRLWMFTICAIDPKTRRVLHRDDAVEHYALEELCAGVHFIGKLG